MLLIIMPGGGDQSLLNENLFFYLHDSAQQMNTND